LTLRNFIPKRKQASGQATDLPLEGIVQLANSQPEAVATTEVDNTPVDNAIDIPISSNWAYDHVAAADPHTGYMLESNIGISNGDYLKIDDAAIVSGNYARFTATGLEGVQTLDDINSLNFTDPTELTINSGAITITQSYHTVDTESDTSSDDLLTINGGQAGDVLFLQPANSARAVYVNDSTGNIYLKHYDTFKSYNFSSPGGGSGTYYKAGYYEAPAADANLNEGSLTQTYGTANVAYAAHAFLVAGGAGTVDAGTASIVVSGTSINDGATRTTADSETIVTDITNMSADEYYETSKKWLGTVTYTLTPAGASTCSADFNYGWAKYEDFGNRHYHLTDFECVGRAGANDSDFNIILFHHSTGDWTYSAAAFVPGGTQIANMNTDHGTEQNTALSEYIAYKRDNLDLDVAGDLSEGFVVKIITGANNSIETMDIHIGGHQSDTKRHLKSTEESIMLINDGTNWIEQ